MLSSPRPKRVHHSQLTNEGIVEFAVTYLNGAFSSVPNICRHCVHDQAQLDVLFSQNRQFGIKIKRIKADINKLTEVAALTESKRQRKEVGSHDALFSTSQEQTTNLQMKIQ
ncbi:hypothetical protein L1987_24047 [Smallanthus sonchifolius]|uniref:Uncharacterized protein n=1 Tax=Smallanthus sonchifolius TaxID=185202 RepID=A0ACB9IIM3_9ASTR|nr:hypothetical protein L1987_24047 [Smallanthus sonchifolius]